MQTTDTQPAAPVAEISIRGTFNRDPNNAYALRAAAHCNEVESWRETAFSVVTADRVLAEIDAARARRARVLLVEINSAGGECGEGWRMHDALRAFSEAGGSVVAYVEHASSAAVEVALAADVVVMANPTDGVFCARPGFAVHAALWNRSLSAEGNAAVRAEVRAGALRRIVPRVATSPETLAGWLSLAEDGNTLRCALLDPSTAIAHGWADTIGTREKASSIATELAAGGAMFSIRALMLAGKLDRSAFPRPEVYPWFAEGIFPDDVGATPAEAHCMLSYKSAAFYSAAPPSNPHGSYDLKADDLWFSTDLTTVCPDVNCKGHAGDANGNPLVGSYSHRRPNWAHRWNGSAWVDAKGAEQIIASEVVGGEALFNTICTGRLKTSNYAEDASGNPTAGAKLDHQGTALKVAPGNLQIGDTVLSVLASTTAMTVGAGWSLTINRVTRSFGVVGIHLNGIVQDQSSASWYSIGTIPADFRPTHPTDNVSLIGRVLDSSTGSSYVANFNIHPDGTVALFRYGNPLALPFTIGNGDVVNLYGSFVRD